MRFWSILLPRCWLLLCLSLMAWQFYRCSEEFQREPTVSSVYVESFTDKYLPQITICPPLNLDEMLKKEELGKHDLVYGRDFLGIQRGAGYVDERIFTWKSRNGTLSAEDVQDLVSWKIEDLLYQVEVKVLGKDWVAFDIRDILDLWTPARWHPHKWTCFKLDLSALKSRIGASRLRKISLLSRLQGGIRIQVHKAGQAYDENIGAEITSGISADPRYYLLSFVDLALKVKKIIPNKHQQCEDTNYDEKLLAKTAERMMSTAGCVVPFVDRMTNSPICEGGERARKAMEVYELVYLEQNLFEREDVLPPCEYFKPAYQVQKNLGRVYDNITTYASITFSPQVEVWEMMEKYSLLSYLAEVGGYLGLLLGYSLFNAASAIAALVDKLKIANLPNFVSI